MAVFGANYPYGESSYKDESLNVDFTAVEPIMLVTFEDRAFFLSHRSRESDDVREYRIGEFLKRGQYTDKFITGA